MGAEGQKEKVVFAVDKFIRPALWSDAKYVCIAAGRRTGKTYNTALWLLSKLLSGGKKSGLWIDTTQNNLLEYVNLYFRNIINPIWAWCRHDRQHHKLEFPNGSYLHMRSAERPELMEGFEYDYVVVNEAGIVFRDPHLWPKTVQAMCKRAQVRLVGTPKGKRGFEDLYLLSKQLDDWESYCFSVYDSPHWEPREIEAVKRSVVDEEVWRQEYLGQFVEGRAFSVITRVSKDSWRGDYDEEYEYNHEWIQRQISDKGFWWCSFDGGMYSKTSAAVIGYRNDRTRRDICVKEVYSEVPGEDIGEIARRVKTWCEHYGIEVERVRVYGDPALAAYQDDQVISDILGSQISLLDGLKKDERYKGMYTARLTSRIGAMKRVCDGTLADNKPEIIIIRGKEEKIYRFDATTCGCPMLFRGVWGHEWRYELGRDNSPTSSLEQNHPIVDVCDALSYFILDTKPDKGKSEVKPIMNYGVLR